MFGRFWVIGETVVGWFCVWSVFGKVVRDCCGFVLCLVGFW